MVDVPEQWQVRQLLQVIESSPLTDEGFKFKRIPSGGHTNTEFQLYHEGYPKAVFYSGWMALGDPTGYADASEGDWHVEMRPGKDGPVEKHHYIPWEKVVHQFTRWVTYLSREFEARVDFGKFVRLPRIPPPGASDTTALGEAEVEVIEPLFLRAEAEVVEIVEEELATREDLDELRAWVTAEFAEVRAEIRRQSKNGLRRTLFGMGANLAMRFGPHIWGQMQPIFEALLRSLDATRVLPPG